MSQIFVVPDNVDVPNLIHYVSYMCGTLDDHGVTITQNRFSNKEGECSLEELLDEIRVYANRKTADITLDVDLNINGSQIMKEVELKIRTIVSDEIQRQIAGVSNERERVGEPESTANTMKQVATPHNIAFPKDLTGSVIVTHNNEKITYIFEHGILSSISQEI